MRKKFGFVREVIASVFVVAIVSISCIFNISAAAASTGPSTHNIYVDNQHVTPTAYLIDGSNYFKLRDIGKLVDFGVSYDNKAKAVRIDTTIGYTPEAGESSEIINSAHSGAEAKLTTQTIYVDGHKVTPTVYLIDGNNFFKLRDLGELVNFGVTYTNETKRVDIFSNLPYGEDGSAETIPNGPITSWNETMWQFHDAMINCMWDSDKYIEVAKKYAPLVTGRSDATVENLISSLESMANAPVSAISYDDKPVNIYWARLLKHAAGITD